MNSLPQLCISIQRIEAHYDQFDVENYQGVVCRKVNL